MCRRSSASILLAVVVALVATAVARADDELIGYLDRVRLSRLLAEHLERELAGGAIGEQRQHIVDRLAEVYPQLLEQEDDPARRDDLVRRSAVLLEKEAPKRGESLRLAMIRARYRGASRVAEDYRVALCDDAAAKDAASALASLAQAAADLRAKLDQRAKDLERRGDRAGGVEGDRIVDRADVFRGMAQEALGLEAWSHYYRSILTDDRSLGEKAQALFGRIIDTGESFPTPKDVSLDLRSNEFFANTLLGMALSKARTESLPTAMEWLALLDVDRVPLALRKQLPAWRLAIAADRSEWAAAREVLHTIVADPATPTAWLRLAAVAGLRAPESNPAAASLVREAIAALASRRELAQIADIARRFGDRAIGSTGFASQYVRGVTTYERARNAKDAGDKTTAANLFRDASEQFESALKASDAAQFESAIASCRTLAGWSRFERGDFDQALTLFTDAASADPRDEEPEWMALVSLEKIVAAMPAGDRRTELANDLRSRIDAFLGRHPSSTKVPELLVRRMALADVPRREDLERLLAMDDGTTGAADAKRQAVLGLYRLFRESRGAERTAAGKRFLAAMHKLAPVGAHPLDGLPGGDPAVARQALEIALSVEVNDPTAAETILAAIDANARAKKLDVTAFEYELTLRRVQLALARDQLPAAMEQLATMEHASDEAARKALDLARRHVFRYASARLRDTSLGTGGTDRGAVVAATVQTGDALIRIAENEAGSLDKAIADATMEAVAFTTAEAIAEASTADVNAERTARGLALAQALIKRTPKDPALLETLATLSAASGDKSAAAECLRQVVAGSVVESERWYRAKVRLIELLADVDPERARAVLRQHVKLQPHYGPSPWGDRLRALEKELGAAPNRDAGGGP
ncbi:MAG: hypothetical protein U0572_09380 [Phycisphaerales bacterium]